ncbi:MAG: multicopper oxidase domain-containing protein [Anaerolineae bacterium]
MKQHTRYFRRVSILLALMATVTLILILSSGLIASASSDHSAANAPASAPMAATLPASTCSLAGVTRTCELWAKAGTLTLPDGNTVPIWGFTDSAGGTAQLPGPPIIVNQGETVEVILHNELVSDSVSLSFPGQALPPDMVGASTGLTTTYTFTPTQPGTYSYEAGMTTNGIRQVAMGLFGALIVRPAGQPGWAYDAASAFDDEALLVFSEIDPALNADPLNFTMGHFAPKYWLINGKAYSQTAHIGVLPGDRLLMRYLNTSLREHSIGILGLEQVLYGVDSFQLPFTKTVTAQTLGSGQAYDALVSIPASVVAGTVYPVYSTGLQQLHNNAALAADGSVAMGGQLTMIEVTSGTALPPDVGPLVTNIAAAPSPTDGSSGVTLTVTLDESATGGSTVVEWEYFINQTGADGTGAVISVVTPTTTLADATIVPSTTLATAPTGDVTFYVHGKDALGNWGPFNSTVIELIITGPTIRGMVLTPPAANGTADVALRATADETPIGQIDVVQAEYFIGAPGANGAGTPMSIAPAPGPIVGVEAVIPAATIAAMPEAFTHTIYIHAQDALGNWGGFGTIDLIVDKSGPATFGVNVTPNPNNGQLTFNSSTFSVRLSAFLGDNYVDVVDAEGFIDYQGPLTDTNGSGFPLMAKDSLFDSSFENAYFDIPLTTIQALAEGSHTFSVHGLDAAGNWGAVSTVTLIVDKTGPAASNAFAFPAVTNGQSVVNLTATVTDPANGTAAASAIAAAEWFEGFDPGLGLGTPMTALDGSFNSSSEDVNAAVNVSGWTNGSHILSVRAQDAAGNWGDVYTTTVQVTGNIPGNILLDFFEGNALNSWNLASGAVNVGPQAALEGTLGMEVAVSTTPAFVSDKTPSNESDYRATFLFDPNGTQTGGDAFDILVGYNWQGTSIFGISYENGPAGPEIQAWARAGGVYTSTMWTHIVDGPQEIQIAWESSDNGYLSLSVDHATQQTLTGLNTTAYRLEEVQLGATGNMTANMTGTLYFDAFMSFRNPPYSIFLPVAYNN